MVSTPKYEYDFETINKLLANHLASNDRDFFIIGIMAKFLPLFLSSIVAVYSVLTSSFFYDVNLVAISSVYITIIAFGVSGFSIFTMIIKNGDVLLELKINKDVSEMDKDSGEYSVLYRYRNIYDNNIVRSIKKTANELLSTAFVILFPAGISDIILGIAFYDLNLGIYSIGQVVTGFVFLAISLMLLLYSVRIEYRNLKKTKRKDTDIMRRIIEKVQEFPLKSEEISVKFDEDGAFLMSS